MKSIRRYLTWKLLPGLLFLVVAGNTLLYLFVYRRMVSEFDAALKARAHAFAGMMEQEPEGITVELRREFLGEYSRKHNAEYYQIWNENGQTIGRSPSLEGRDLPRRTGTLESPVFWNLVLPDGRPGRAIGVGFSPFTDYEDIPLIRKRVEVQVVLARDRTEISNMLRVLFLGTVSLVIIIITGIITMVPRVVMSGLSPLRRLADYTAAIDSKSLGSRYNTDHLPDELLPVVRRLNELLERLEHAFAREKRLTADMAHELKTPIAELRSLAEVALKWPDDAGFVNKALADACEISKQMDRTVSVLLALGRCESGRQNVSPAPVDVRGMIQETWEPWQKTADEKHISVRFDLPGTAEVITDSVMLSSILTNLFSNAVEYCPDGGHVECCLKVDSADVTVSVKNSNESLTEDDLTHMFEYLWRKDPAGSDGIHSGLGLPLASAFARCLAIDIGAELLRSGDFRITLVIPSVFPG